MSCELAARVAAAPRDKVSPADNTLVADNAAVTEMSCRAVSDSDVVADSWAEMKPSINPATSKEDAAANVATGKTISAGLLVIAEFAANDAVGRTSHVEPAVTLVEAASVTVGSSVTAPVVNIPDEAVRFAAAAIRVPDADTDNADVAANVAPAGIRSLDAFVSDVVADSVADTKIVSTDAAERDEAAASVEVSC